MPFLVLVPDIAENQLKPGDDNSLAPAMTLRKRFRRFVSVLAVVVLSLLKTTIHWAGLEFLTLNAVCNVGAPSIDLPNDFSKIL